MPLFPPLSLADVKRLVLQRVQREGSDFVNTATELVDYIDLAGEEWLAHLQTVAEACLKDTGSVQVPAGQNYVRLTTNFAKLVVARLVKDGYKYPLKPYGDHEITETDSRAWSGVDIPKYQLRFAGVNNTIGLSNTTYPRWYLYFDRPPSETESLTITYRMGWRTWNTSKSGLSERVQVPYVRGVILRAAQMCLAKERADTSQIEREIAMLEKQVEVWSEPYDQGGTVGINDARSIEGDDRPGWW